MFQWWALTCFSSVPPPPAPRRGSHVQWNSKEVHNGVTTTSDAKEGCVTAVSAAKVVVGTLAVLVATLTRGGGPNPGYYGNIASHRCRHNSCCLGHCKGDLVR